MRAERLLRILEVRYILKDRVPPVNLIAALVNEGIIYELEL